MKTLLKFNSQHTARYFVPRQTFWLVSCLGLPWLGSFTACQEMTRIFSFFDDFTWRCNDLKWPWIDFFDAVLFMAWLNNKPFSKPLMTPHRTCHWKAFERKILDWMFLRGKFQQFQLATQCFGLISVRGSCFHFRCWCTFQGKAYQWKSLKTLIPITVQELLK